MNKKTLTALKGSIEKWKKIIAGKGIDERQYNCPLCQLFPDTCFYCPVCKGTGREGCNYSPWEKWAEHQRLKHDGDMKVYCPTCKKLANAELKFLKRLLPRMKP
jgi:hypothetical protein